ncbi:MAG: phosphate/phosphite/phosphonate ABC transporter substrate-binding protein [Candidatus Thiodiazotropha lotti]|nr:phosphate/phosphite/phosphonate ABC transporter substrate-binding protein [Candidatus Thiodiazotropha lotti]MCW4194192.1 phosphate/phosphite/phosphonate ABC transporter substrate-binding protein [Candidatus Thiodiazotropha lotti]
MLMLISLNLSPAQAYGLASVREIAIFPYLSPQKLVQLYAPLSKALTSQLGHPVRVVSAPDYTSFMERLRQGEYTLVINAAHMARVAQLDYGYLPLLRPQTDLEAVLLVSSQAPYTEISQLRGATAGVPSRTALITQMASQMFQESGLEPGIDIKLIHHPTHSSAAMDVIQGNTQAAVISSRALDQLQDRLAGKLRKLTGSSQISGTLPGRTAPIIYQVSPELDKTSSARLAEIILDFANNSEAGRKFIDQFGYQGLRPTNHDDMQSLNPFLPALRRQQGEVRH